MNGRFSWVNCKYRTSCSISTKRCFCNSQSLPQTLFNKTTCM